MTKKIIIAFIVIGILSFLLGLLVGRLSKHDTIETPLDTTNDSLKTVNLALKAQFKVDSLRIDSLVKNTGLVKEKIVYLKNKQNEKVRIISALNNDELYNYLSNIKTDSIPTR